MDEEHKSDPVAGVLLALDDFRPIRRGPDGQPIDPPSKEGGISKELREHPGAAAE